MTKKVYSAGYYSSDYGGFSDPCPRCKYNNVFAPSYEDPGMQRFSCSFCQFSWLEYIEGFAGELDSEVASTPNDKYDSSERASVQDDVDTLKSTVKNLQKDLKSQSQVVVDMTAQIKQDMVTQDQSILSLQEEVKGLKSALKHLKSQGNAGTSASQVADDKCFW